MTSSLLIRAFITTSRPKKGSGSFDSFYSRLSASRKMKRAFISAIALSFLALVDATQINITVGPSSENIYSPSSVSALQGDVILFRFVSRNHTVTQSSFADPCTPLASGVNSGFRPANTTSQPTFTYTITNSSTPLWFYCAQSNHCVNGMVFGINPTAEKSFDAFQAKAKSLNPNSTSSSYGSPTSSSSSATPSSSDVSSAMRSGESSLGITMAAAALVFGLVL